MTFQSHKTVFPGALSATSSPLSPVHKQNRKRENRTPSPDSARVVKKGRLSLYTYMDVLNYLNSHSDEVVWALDSTLRGVLGGTSPGGVAMIGNGVELELSDLAMPMMPFLQRGDTQFVRLIV